MEKRMVTTVNCPLLYISQPNFLEVKPKMQQMCVVKPKAPIIEKMSDTLQIDNVNEEEKPIPIENIIEAREISNENLIEDKQILIENIIKEKQLPVDNIIEKTKLSKQIEPIIEEKLEPNENAIDEKALAKRKMIATYGIKSSFEKGKKAARLQKKANSDINNILAAYGLKSSIEKGKKTITLPTKEFTIMNDEAELELEQVKEEQQEIIKLEETIEKTQKPRPFKVLSIEEKVDYLIHLPLGVPKIKCEFNTKQGMFQGVVAGYVDGVVRIVQSRKPHQLNVKIEDIIAINRKSF